MNNHIIGIDPDLVKSGLAVYSKKTNRLILTLASFPDLIKSISSFNPKDTIVYVEAGWLNNKSNYRPRNNSMPAHIDSLIRERTAKNVGENHAVGKIIFEYLTNLGYLCELVRPTKNKASVLLFKSVANIETKKSHQELRDAGMLIANNFNKNTETKVITK